MVAQYIFRGLSKVIPCHSTPFRNSGINTFIIHAQERQRIIFHIRRNVSDQVHEGRDIVSRASVSSKPKIGLYNQTYMIARIDNIRLYP